MGAHLRWKGTQDILTTPATMGLEWEQHRNTCNVVSRTQSELWTGNNNFVTNMASPYRINHSGRQFSWTPLVSTSLVPCINNRHRAQDSI